MLQALMFLHVHIAAFAKQADARFVRLVGMLLENRGAITSNWSPR